MASSFGDAARTGQGQDAEEDAEQDAGIGTVRRLYFYLVAFVSLMMFVSGVALLLQFVFDSIFGGDVIRSPT